MPTIHAPRIEENGDGCVLSQMQPRFFLSYLQLDHHNAMEASLGEVL